MYKGPLPFLLSDIDTEFFPVLAEISPKAIGRGEIIGVVIQNPLTFPDGTTNTSEIFFGSGTNMIYFMIPGQESPYFTGEDLKDFYVRLNFPAENPNGGVATADVDDAARGLGYTVGDVLTLADKGNGEAEVTVDTVIEGVSDGDINNAGTGYAEDDILTIDGGSTLTTIRVLTVGGAGEIDTWEFVGAITARGDGYAVGTEDLTGGSGVDATFDITELTNAINTISVTTPGAGYTAGDESEATGGSGSDAIIIVETVDITVPESANINCIIYRKRKGGLQ